MSQAAQQAESSSEDKQGNDKEKPQPKRPTREQLKPMAGYLTKASRAMVGLGLERRLTIMGEMEDHLVERLAEGASVKEAVEGMGSPSDWAGEAWIDGVPDVAHQRNISNSLQVLGILTFTLSWLFFVASVAAYPDPWVGQNGGEGMSEKEIENESQVMDTKEKDEQKETTPYVDVRPLIKYLTSHSRKTVGLGLDHDGPDCGHIRY